MSEPSGDTPNPLPDAPPFDPAGSVLPKAPRANPPSVFNQKAAPPDAAPPGFQEFTAWMKMLSGGTVAEDQTAAGRPLIPKDQKKFSRKTVEATPAGHPSPAEGEGVQPPTSPEKTAGTSPAKAAPPSSPLTPRTFERKRPKTSPLLALFTQCLVFVLLVGSFFLGRATVPKNLAAKPSTAPSAPAVTQDGKTPGLLSAALAAKVNQANALQSSGDYRGALALLEEVQQQGGYVYGLDYHLAFLHYAAGDLPRVVLLLNKSIAEGEQVAASYNLRGVLFNRQAVDKGLSDLKLAAQLDPFDAKDAFFVGEALRRQGKPQAALEYLQQAVNRLDNPFEESFYQFKYRLALLEAGREQEFAPELTAKLALNPPPVDWLFTAAAVEIHRGNLPAAGADLDKAQAQVPPAEMNAYLRDYYFYSFAQDKTLSRFFGSLNPRAAPSVGQTAVPSRAPLLSTVPGEASPPDVPAHGILPDLP